MKTTYYPTADGPRPLHDVPDEDLIDLVDAKPRDTRLAAEIARRKIWINWGDEGHIWEWGYE